MPQAGFEPTITEGKRLQTDVLDRDATGIGRMAMNCRRTEEIHKRAVVSATLFAQISTQNHSAIRSEEPVSRLRNSSYATFIYSHITVIEGARCRAQPPSSQTERDSARLNCSGTKTRGLSPTGSRFAADCKEKSN